jgi:hypothetical protein
MNDPIKLPPLTVRMLMDVFGSHARIPPALLSASWKDGVDIDEPSVKAQQLVESFARLAVEQATADLRNKVNELNALCKFNEGTIEQALDGWKKAEAERDEARAELARLTTLAHKHEWFRTGEMEPGEIRCINCGAWGKEETPLPDVKEAK